MYTHTPHDPVYALHHCLNSTGIAGTPPPSLKSRLLRPDPRMPAKTSEQSCHISMLLMKFLLVRQVGKNLGITIGDGLGGIPSFPSEHQQEFAKQIVKYNTTS